MRIVISSGHGLLVRGASGIIDEVDEARRVVEEAAKWLRINGHKVITFHDDTSTTQGENLDTIVNFHNSQDRDLDVSVHFNAYIETVDPMGTECLYLTQQELAGRVASAISKDGDLINRGAKKRTDLAFLNGTDEPAILIEVCFVDSEADVTNYKANFELICEALGSMGIYTNVPEVAFFSGPCSWFGGPDDAGVDPDEGLAFLYDYDDAPHLFLMEQPPDTTGLARRLNPEVHYVACRWDYNVTPKQMLADPTLRALVVNKRTGRGILAWPADWGPHEDTGRAADLSPALLDELELDTNDEVEVVYPAKRKGKK
jgi:N-acetylmuramoyl-L-alanine amidase